MLKKHVSAEICTSQLKPPGTRCNTRLLLCQEAKDFKPARNEAFALPIPLQACEKACDFFSSAPEEGEEGRQARLASLGNFAAGRGRGASRPAGGGGGRRVLPGPSFALGEGDRARGGGDLSGLSRRGAVPRG